jgi:hypothetical protein
MNQPITDMTSEEQRFQFLLAIYNDFQWPGEAEPVNTKSRVIGMENSEGVFNGHILQVFARDGLEAGYVVVHLVKDSEGVLEILEDGKDSTDYRYFPNFAGLKDYVAKIADLEPHEHANVPLDDRYVEPVPYSRIVSLQNLPEVSPEEAFMHSLEGIYSYTFGSETTVVRTGCVISDRGYVYQVSTPENALAFPSSFFPCNPVSYANLKDGARQFDVTVYHIDAKGHLSFVTDDRYKPINRLCHGFEDLCAYVGKMENSLPDLEENPGPLAEDCVRIPVSSLLPEPSGYGARENIMGLNPGAERIVSGQPILPEDFVEKYLIEVEGDSKTRLFSFDNGYYARVYYNGKESPQFVVCPMEATEEGKLVMHHFYGYNYHEHDLDSVRDMMQRIGEYATPAKYRILQHDEGFEPVPFSTFLPRPKLNGKELQPVEGMLYSDKVKTPVHGLT